MIDSSLSSNCSGPKKIYRLKEDQAFLPLLELGRRDKVARHPSAEFLNDNSGKFATGVNDISGKLPLVSMIPVVIEDFYHLPQVSSTPVVHLELRIFPRIFKRFEMALMGYSLLRGLRETET